MTLKHQIRELSLRHLSPERHAGVALAYTRFASWFKECGIRKPGDHVVDCGLPLVYISQPPRSGGTMLRNLFDGHSQCLAFPHELSWEQNGFVWGDSLASTTNVRAAFDLLYDRWIPHAIVNGIDKKLPFRFNRALQRRLFSSETFRREGHAGRPWLDRYFTSFFNAWVDYQGLNGPEKRYCVAFCPSTFPIQGAEMVQRFFDVYPDGFRIQIVRDPLNWWASEKHYAGRVKDAGMLDEYLETHWAAAVKVGLQLVDSGQDRHILLDYDHLVLEPESSLRRLCEKLGLDFEACLLNPTINKMVRLSNSSFGQRRKDIDPTVTERWKTALEPAEVARIREVTEDAYRRARAACINAR